MATHSSILARKIPWTEEPGGLQCMGPQRVIHDEQPSVPEDYMRSLHPCVTCTHTVQARLQGLNKD